MASGQPRSPRAIAALARHFWATATGGALSIAARARNHFRLDLIVTPDRVLRPRRSRPQPSGIIPDHLTDEIRENVPLLSTLGLT